MTDWQITMKPDVITDLTALSSNEMRLVMKKIDMLTQDPTPDGDSKKQLTHIDPRLHRIRCGDYRLFYTFEHPSISLLALRRRQEDTYSKGLKVEFFKGVGANLTIPGNPITGPLSPLSYQEPSSASTSLVEDALPRPITEKLLNDLHIPAQYHAHLLAVETGEELLDCPDVPEALLLRLLDHLTSPLPALNEEESSPPSDPIEQPLPKPITRDLLANLRIPARYHDTLLAIRSKEELLACDVPAPMLTQLHTHLFPRLLKEVTTEPDFVLNEVDDISRFKDGELLGFLLKLSDEQEKYVQWRPNAKGPALLKGGPGSGKSTIALYRVRELVHYLRQQGRNNFRVLFATYTDALMRTSKQLLQQILKEDICYVDVKTTDRVALSVLGYTDVPRNLASEEDIKYCLVNAIEGAGFGCDSRQLEKERQALKQLTQDYIEQEINQVIIARELASLHEYQHTARPGRKVALNANQRTVIWSIYNRYIGLLKACGCVTWQQLRVQAEQYVAQGRVNLRYDAVIIDEVQDLDVSALRMLTQLCVSPDRLFITADANQSIYGSGFSWEDVHANLRFRGRTATLHTNYRSTRQIGMAALSYLGQCGLDPEVGKQDYVNSGGTRPLVRALGKSEDEAELLKHFLMTTAQELGFGFGSCAVLCPNKPVGQRIAERLSRIGLQATFMSGRDVDLERPEIKVLMMKATKGLEFPIVAIAGFLGSNKETSEQHADHQGERDEALARDRRSLYVGMTRAMRALMIVIPHNISIPLLTGFHSAYWDYA